MLCVQPNVRRPGTGLRILGTTPSPAPTHIPKLLSPVASVSEDFYMYIWLSFLCPTTRRTRLDNKHVIIALTQQCA